MSAPPPSLSLGAAGGATDDDNNTGFTPGIAFTGCAAMLGSECARTFPAPTGVVLISNGFGLESNRISNLVSDLVYRFVVIAKVYVDQTDNKTDSDLGQAPMKAAEQENDAMCHDAHVTKPDSPLNHLNPLKFLLGSSLTMIAQ